MKLLDCLPTVEQPTNLTINSLDLQYPTPKCVVQVEGPDTLMNNSLARKLFSSFRSCGFYSCSTARSEFSHSHLRTSQKPLALTYHAYFGIKYYPLDPTSIGDEQTRYQIFLQVRSDLIGGQMQVNEELFVTLCGFILQSDCGDYGADRLGNSYVRDVLKLPNLEASIEQRIKSKHDECRGRQPALVEYQLLDKVKCCPTYGQTKFCVKEMISNAMCLFSIGPGGIFIENGRQNLIHFTWAQITGFKQKNKQLLIKVCTEITRFIYRCSVDNSQTCHNLLQTCKDYLLFYKSELSNQLFTQPCFGTYLTNVTNCTRPSYYDPNSYGLQSKSLYTHGSSKCDFLVPSMSASLSTCSKPSVIQSPHLSSSSTTFMTKALSNQLYQPKTLFSHLESSNHSNIPCNPYHVPSAASDYHGNSVFYRPRGCETVTDVGHKQYRVKNENLSNNHYSLRQSYQSVRQSHRTKKYIRDVSFRSRHRNPYTCTKYYFIDEGLLYPKCSVHHSINYEQSVQKISEKYPNQDSCIHETVDVSHTSSKSPKQDYNDTLLCRPVSRLGVYCLKKRHTTDLPCNYIHNHNHPSDHHHHHQKNVNINSEEHVNSSSTHQRLCHDECACERSVCINLNDTHINDLNTSTNYNGVKIETGNVSTQYHSNLISESKSVLNEETRQADDRSPTCQVIQICTSDQIDSNHLYDQERMFEFPNPRNNSESSSVFGSFQYSDSQDPPIVFEPYLNSVSSAKRDNTSFDEQYKHLNGDQLALKPGSISLYNPEESRTPSLLKSSDLTSDICESVCTSLQRFRLPPTPSSLNKSVNLISRGDQFTEPDEHCVSEFHFPSPPSVERLVQLQENDPTHIIPKTCSSVTGNSTHPLPCDIENMNSNNTEFGLQKDFQLLNKSRGRKLPLTPSKQIKISNQATETTFSIKDDEFFNVV